jgi:type II secretory pathway component PulF
MKFWIQMGSAVVLHGVAGLLVLVALLFVVPSITPLFAEFGATLPTATRISIALADFAAGTWFVSIPLAGLVTAAHLVVLVLLARREGQFPFWTYSLVVMIGMSVASIFLFGSMYLPIFQLG